MPTIEEKRAALQQVHALVYSQVRGEYAHVKASIPLSNPDSYPRPTYISVRTQIGQSQEDGLLNDLRQPAANMRGYGHRIEYDGSDGLSSSRLKELSALLRRFEKDASRFGGTTAYMLAAFTAAKARYVFLEPIEGRGHRDLVEFEMLDLRKPADVVRFSQWMDERVEILWDKTAPQGKVERLRRELAAQAEASAAEAGQAEHSRERAA